MPSLKHSQMQLDAEPRISLSKLPNEILDVILQYVFYSSGGYTSSILPVARTCKHIRESTYPYFFGRLIIKADQDIIEKRSWECLQYLLLRPHLMKNIRCLEIQTALQSKELPCEADIVSARMGQTISRKRLMDCLRLMTGLRSLKLHYLSDMNFDILEQLTASDSLELSLDLSKSMRGFVGQQFERLQQIMVRSPAWLTYLSLPPAKYVHVPANVTDVIKAAKVGAIDWYDNWEALHLLLNGNHHLQDLEELHVSSKILAAQDLLLLREIIPWTRLKRLHVEGDRQIKHLLSSVVNKLLNLEDLCLHASTTDAFHDNCLDTSRRAPKEPLAYTQLQSLKHLSLRGICPHLHARLITTPYLRSLAIVLPEYHARLRSLNEVRTPDELKWIANNLPHLQHLEIQIGSLENLWHPTAIPGVEVNVEVYAALQTIAQIPNLHTLRLFPPYVPRNAGHDHVNARQPLSDEQAIRVFRHLHSQRPTHHTLSIAATFYTLRGFAPFSWLVRQGGPGKTMLTTRQAGKDYEVEQTWIGERRMTLRTRKHSYRRPFLVDLKGGWVFPVQGPTV